MKQRLSTYLRQLEAESIHIMREVAAEFRNPVMLYSIGKDSSVMLHLALKAFYPGKPPFPLLHVDTTWKFRQMIEFRDAEMRRLGLELIVHTNEQGVKDGLSPIAHGSALYTDIMKTEAVQRTTSEDDCLQTLELCNKIKEIHGKKVVLNGTCQGGYICLMNILSGKLTKVCDTLITNVTPIDGTYSDAISGVPQMHSDFVTTPLPNGNKVANGYMLSLGMKFVAIDRETPLVKVLDQASLHRATEMNPGKTPAALFRWLLKERVHLPLEISKMSSCTFQNAIAEDGTLPVQLFGKPLNIKDLATLGVKWYQNGRRKGHDPDLQRPPRAHRSSMAIHRQGCRVKRGTLPGPSARFNPRAGSGTLGAGTGPVRELTARGARRRRRARRPCASRRHAWRRGSRDS